jgi:C1A family cysteine protease
MQRITFGWRPDYPDFRDYTPETRDIPISKKGLGIKKSVKELLKEVGLKTDGTEIPVQRDLRQWCSPVEDQLNLGSCTAQAAVAALEYFEKRAFGIHLDASRLFVYKVTRNLLGWSGDTGAHNRTTMAALVLFGVPPEQYWPYIEADFDAEPSAFCYSFARNYQTVQYYKLDSPGIAREALLTKIKEHLAYALPLIFGFTVFSSYEQGSDDGKIPYPGAGETAVGGHAVLAVGYDDKLVIENSNSGKKTKGALLFKNSWGTGWGDKGYGWLPYDYILNYLAVDWWTLTKAEWIDTKNFNLDL